MAIAELLTIGNEILDGRVTDTNRVFLGKKLIELGVEIPYAQSVDDDLPRVVEMLRLACSRSDLIICTGGLGPTSDDLTAEAVAKFLGCAWEVNPEAEKFIRELFAKRNRVVSDSQLKQARLPVLCKMIHNPVGTAPGFFFKGKIAERDVALYFFPGIPKEMHPMFEQSVLKDLAKSGNPLRKYTWSTLFTSEGDLQEKLKAAEKKLAPFKLGFRTHLPENHISLMGKVGKAEEPQWQQSVLELQKILSPLAYNEGSEREYEPMILAGLQAKRARLLTVESCTGGLISHLLTDIPGSSQSVWGAQVCYANEEKFRLGVDPEIVKRQGAVSPECAQAMAQAGLERLKKDSLAETNYLVSLATTGIAGPGGATDTKEVGLMYMALATLHIPTHKTEVWVEKVQAPNFFERKSMKLYFAKKALEYLRVNFLLKTPS